MNRRQLLKYFTTAVSMLLVSCSPGLRVFVNDTFRRVRPTDPLWPSEAEWNSLRQEVGNRFIQIESALTTCRGNPEDLSCAEFFKRLKNPYFIRDNPALTQTSGFADAWISTPSAYAVAIEKTADVVAAVNFAREHNLRLVVKGGGHSYQGGSCSADSLLIWLRNMDNIAILDEFVPQGCSGRLEPQPAVTIEAGAVWGEVYDEVTTKAGRYVQGGGCTTVGVAGLIQSGGFGSFSKGYGLAAAGLLEAEVVTADGKVVIANACTNSDLFWALKGGGGGSFGVVTKVTLKTRTLPEYFGAVFGTIKANSDTAFRNLISQTVTFYRDRLFNPFWGEQISFGSNNTVELSLVFQGLNRGEVEKAWRSFLDWVTVAPEDYVFEVPFGILDLPAQHLWDAQFLKEHFPDLIVSDNRPGSPEYNFFWAATQKESGQFLHAYHSTWLSASLLEEDRQSELSEAIFAASRHWSFSLHFNKGLAGAPAAELDAARDTPMNPLVLDAFALVIMGSESQPAFPGVLGYEPDVSAARRHARAVERAMTEVLRVVDSKGSYLAESNFFESDWQQSFWGSNYSRLKAIKKKYDPDGLFFIHHGVGSEDWSSDGFNRIFT